MSSESWPHSRHTRYSPQERFRDYHEPEVWAQGSQQSENMIPRPPHAMSDPWAQGSQQSQNMIPRPPHAMSDPWAYGSQPPYNVGPPPHSTSTSMPQGYHPVSTPFNLAFDPHSSVQTHGRSDNEQGNVVMDVLRTGLVGLRDGAAMTGIPYIAPIANLLLRTANIRDDMKQFTGDWAVVMDKLQKITYLLDNVGNLCALHQLEERHLPPSLRQIFQALRTGLDELRRELEQIQEPRPFMQSVMSPMDTRQMVRQCDGKLANLLQAFELALAIDSRLEQIQYNHQHSAFHT